VTGVTRHLIGLTIEVTGVDDLLAELRAS